MARPSNTAQRRREITAALIDVMAQRGYEGASTQAVAEAAGLSPGLVHYHFASKREILVAAVEALVEGVEQRYATRREGAASAQAELDAFVDAHLALGDDADPDAVAAWVVVGTTALHEEVVRHVYAEAIEGRVREAEARLRACAQERGHRPRSMRRQAAGLVAVIEGYYRLSAAAPSVIPSGSAAKTVRAMIDGLLASRSA